MEPASQPPPSGLVQRRVNSIVSESGDLLSPIRRAEKNRDGFKAYTASPPFVRVKSGEKTVRHVI
jgi:hypothetical protein